MAQVILSGIGSAIGGPIGGALGKLAGSLIDRAAIDALTPARIVGRNLLGLQLNSTAEGAPMSCAFGRARLSGQIIWAANFKQSKIAALTGGGKGGPNIETYSYSLSFAVAVCEGPIDGFGQVWADGQAMDMTGVVMRTYLGDEAQSVDPLIEAIEGTAPSYRGVAYVVFEDLVLDNYGARPPEFAFEVFRRPIAPGGPPRLEDRLTGVCLIPGAGEFVLATQTVLRRDGLTVSTAENVNNPSGRPDLLVSLDQLQAQLPRVDTVTLVVAWFGTDLRCGSCAIMPGVEAAAKSTIPITWSVGGLAREDAHLISTSEGGPAYGGTPADATVLQAIAELKARGIEGLALSVPDDGRSGGQRPARSLWGYGAGGLPLAWAHHRRGGRGQDLGGGDPNRQLFRNRRARELQHGGRRGELFRSGGVEFPPLHPAPRSVGAGGRGRGRLCHGLGDARVDHAPVGRLNLSGGGGVASAGGGLPGHAGD